MEQETMDTSSGSRRIGNGTFGRSERSEEELNVVVEDGPFDEPFYDAQQSFPELNSATTTVDSSASPNGSSSKAGFPRRPSDVGSIPLKSYSLEIIDAVGPGELKGKYDVNNTMPSDDQLGDYVKSKTADPEENGKQDGDEPKIDFLKDDPSEMTNGRRIALWMMKRYAWYNPHLNDEVDRTGDYHVLDGGNYRTQDGYPVLYTKEEQPSLEKAWAYFDHVAMPRYLLEEKEAGPKKGLLTRMIRKFQKADKQMDRAEPGEAELPTRLYSPIFTPHKQLGDFGLGIGLYFSTIRALTVLVLCAGIIHIPNFMYFSGEEYSKGQPSVPDLMKGSAICTDVAWVPCPTCQPENFSYDSFLAEEDKNMTFAKKNNCEGVTLETGFVNYAALIFVLAGVIMLSKYLKTMEVQFDEDEQTAQDYSIVINNPPGDATDPEEWREYFRRAFGAQPVGCTVAVDNDLLVRTLVERREKMRRLELMVEPGTSLDIVTLAGIAVSVERHRTLMQKLLAMVAPGIPEIFSRMAVLTAKVQGLAQQDYPVTNVFVTFETEAGQRRVLEKLTVGQSAIDRNRTSSVGDAKYLFRGFRVLSVAEPEEPDSIRWEDLNVGFLDRLKQQFFTALATVVALLLVGFLVYFVNDKAVAATSMTIAVANAIFPMFAKALTYNEAHPSHGSLQTSLYFKIALFRWVTTAIIIAIVTPFEDTLLFGTNGLIQQVYAQFFAEVTTTSAIQLADPVGHIQRHFLAPRATTQDAMNLNMQGSKFELAERYTAVAKLIFLTLWYCTVYPGSFFFCAFALQVIYYLDKLSLTRTWKRVPKLGATISQFNRAYFLPISILAMAIVSSYYWTGFPFDNLCESDEPVPDSYIGVHRVPQYEQESLANVAANLAGRPGVAPISIRQNFTISVEAGATTYRYCNQDLVSEKFRFPFIPMWQEEGEEWMTPDQETVTLVYGWTACGFLILFFIITVGTTMMGFCSYFYGHYEPTGEDQGENFSELESANIYIPQVESPVFSYPLLACCVDNIDKDMLDWTDPDHPHAFYDLTKDARAMIRGTDISQKVVFSQVAHWPPEKN